MRFVGSWCERSHDLWNDCQELDQGYSLKKYDFPRKSQFLADNDMVYPSLSQFD